MKKIFHLRLGTLLKDGLQPKQTLTDPFLLITADKVYYGHIKNSTANWTTQILL